MTTDPKSPATSRQRWALFCKTKKDYRNVEITFEEAHKILSEGEKYVKKASAKKGLKEFMLMDENIKKLLHTLNLELDIKGIVKTDTSMLPDDGKRYLMLGGGCGFSFIRTDGRSKKATAILNEVRPAKDAVEREIIKRVGLEQVDRLRKCGNPIQALFLQNLAYNNALNWIVVRYMEEQGIKKATVDSRYD